MGAPGVEAEQNRSVRVEELAKIVVLRSSPRGTCLVRVVHSWFTSSDKWDHQYEGTEHGWVAFFRILRLYLMHFPGQAGSSLQFMGFTSPPVPRAWEALTTPLGLSGAAEGQHVESRQSPLLPRRTWPCRSS